MNAPRVDLAGLAYAEFAAWSRGLAGHADRFHRALYRHLMDTGRWAPAEVGLWREAETRSPGICARLAAAAAAAQHPAVARLIAAHDPQLGPTRKLALTLADGLEAEAVLIPMKAADGRPGHYTVCVSSQVGCRMGCTFCHTARLGLVRSLEPHEIVGQVLAARAATGVAPRNVVFMGMGEPLDNLAAVAQAVAVLTERSGLGLAHRHITISTVGRADRLPELVARGLHRVNLAVSLGVADDTRRSRLMPVNRVHDLAALKRALQAVPIPRDRRLLVSYVLLAGENDSADDAAKLIDWLSGLRALVNLIPFNAFAGSDHRRPSDAAILAFRDALDHARIPVRLRLTKGDDVMAACGQLGNPALRKGGGARNRQGAKDAKGRQGEGSGWSSEMNGSPR